MGVLKHLTVQLPEGPAIPSLSIHPEERKALPSHSCGCVTTGSPPKKPLALGQPSQTGAMGSLRPQAAALYSDCLVLRQAGTWRGSPGAAVPALLSPPPPSVARHTTRPVSSSVPSAGRPGDQRAVWSGWNKLQGDDGWGVSATTRGVRTRACRRGAAEQDSAGSTRHWKRG